MAEPTPAKPKRRPGIVTILLGILALFLFPTLLVLGTFVYEVQRAETVQTDQYMETETRALINGVSSEIDGVQLFLRLVRRAVVPVVERGNADECRSLVTEIEAGEQALSGYFVTDTAGTVTCAADADLIDRTVADTDYFQAVRLGGRLFIGAPEFDARDRAVVPVAIPWESNGAFGGVIGATIDLPVIIAKVRTSYALPESVVMLSSSDGVILSLVPDPGGLVGSRLAGTEAPFIDGADRDWASEQISVAGDLLTISVGVPRAIIEERTPQVAWWLYAVLAAIVAAALLIALAAGAVYVRRPVRALANAARRLGTGDRSARAGDVGGARELTSLGQSFDTMASHLDAREAENERYRAQLEEARDDLERRVEERTSDLNAMTQTAELKARTVERRFLQERRLREIVTLIQASQDLDESAVILRNRMPDLFPSTRGAMALFSETQSQLETIAQWGETGAFSRTFTPSQCWALRLGTPYSSGAGGEGNPRCAHLEAPDVEIVCAPILVQGEARGVISIDLSQLPEEIAGSEGEHAIDTVETAAATIGIALYNVRLRTALRKMSIRDTLTGLHNRRFADDVIAKEVSRARRSHQPLSIVRIDIDRFKAINDEFGFEAGDTILREMASAIGHFFRYEDVCSRYGGQDFLIVMVGAAKPDAVNRCDRLRGELGERAYFFKGTALPRVSVSVGVATYPEDGTTEDDLVVAAEGALQTAKHDGRDRVRAAPGQPPAEDGTRDTR
ncbi:diguanylate cyclase [Amorphus orientalis]|uniref:diguanylate cyclase n=1 Tax=Amorphus orientalis TaxID=649198 RepID=A0AAE3VS32_9HYPH|nr:diguanylate cyclase [Amorphus orientalis]MDQ0316923.1 diguanylate cyclase (GGDEF)-like protein [Amorphus orientalis]